MWHCRTPSVSSVSILGSQTCQQSSWNSRCDGFDCTIAAEMHHVQFIIAAIGQNRVLPCVFKRVHKGKQWLPEGKSGNVLFRPWIFPASAVVDSPKHFLLVDFSRVFIYCIFFLALLVCSYFIWWLFSTAVYLSVIRLLFPSSIKWLEAYVLLGKPSLFSRIVQNAYSGNQCRFCI